MFDKLLDKKKPKEPTLFLDIRFIILNKYLDDNCRKSKIIVNARERKQKDKCSHIQNKKNYIKILQNKKMKSIRREIKRLAIFNMKHIPHFHRKKLKSNTNPITSIKFLSCMFLTCMQILHLKIKTNLSESKDEYKLLLSFKIMAEIIIKYFFIDIDSEYRKFLLKDLLDIMNEIKELQYLFNEGNPKFNIMLQSISIDNDITLEDCNKKLEELSYDKNSLVYFNRISLTDITILLEYGVSVIDSNSENINFFGLNDNSSKIDCLSNILKYEYENINELITIVASLTVGASVCPFTLIVPLLIIFLKTLNCLLDGKLKIFFKLVDGFIGIPNIDIFKMNFTKPDVQFEVPEEIQVLENDIISQEITIPLSEEQEVSELDEEEEEEEDEALFDDEDEDEYDDKQEKKLFMNLNLIERTTSKPLLTDNQIGIIMQKVNESVMEMENLEKQLIRSTNEQRI